ncbi:MAG: gliding motility-associated C-terminal domain-containing protein [Flavobacteriaceae bacterium]|nr:gliding motility-associated C-terminal domain-containing protein [Flavobacteriaceae bacterium]
MKKLSTYLLLTGLLFSGAGNIYAQANYALATHGNIQMHAGASIGFHTNLINNQSFDTNLGLVGFYSTDETLSIEGTHIPRFHNFEVDTKYNLELYTSVDVLNDMSFINGLIITPRDEVNIALNYLSNSMFAGESDLTYIDGYASVIGIENFTFPIGDDDRLRPLIIPENTSFFKAAYFFEDPNSPDYFNDNFDTDQLVNTLTNVSTLEFWDLNGAEETSVTLTWDDVSDLHGLTPILKKLRVVGWNKNTLKWDNLGNTGFTGGFSNGSISSIPFTPNDYEVITLGSDLRGVLSPDVITDNINYVISPNEDGVNDYLVFDNIEVFYNNQLTIYNRWGSLVYKAIDYKNSWDGTSDHSLTISQTKKLPTGTYFYVLYLNDKSKTRKGWVYITR